MLPVSLWDRSKIKDDKYKQSYKELDSLRKAHVFVSKNKGKTWERKGGVRFPKPKFDEHCLIEKTDGSIWMSARTDDGIWESYSNNKGETWSAPQKYMEHINSRHFIRRLKSGKLLLVRHGEIDKKTVYRSELMAYLSKDEGKTWDGGLMLDERRGISYPDGFQDTNGMIFISYDRNRATDGEILMVSFSEKDILNKSFYNLKSRKKILISKPEGLDKQPPPSEKFININSN
jgi:hypothetical protein